MHIWVDIDDYRHVGFIRALTDELAKEGFYFTVTAENTEKMKDALLGSNLSNVEFLGKQFSFLWFLKKQSNIFRTTALIEFMKTKKVELAISFGSIPMLYSCSYFNIPIVYIINDIKKNPDPIYVTLRKCFFITSDRISDNGLRKAGYNPQKVVRYEGHINLLDPRPHPEMIKEIASKFEIFRRLVREHLIA